MVKLLRCVCVSIATCMPISGTARDISVNIRFVGDALMLKLRGELIVFVVLRAAQSTHVHNSSRFVSELE